MEIAILSDTTGSMEEEIDMVQEQALEIVNTVFSRYSNARIGVFGYNDPDVQTFSDLSDDRTVVVDAINELYATDGGDTPEMTYHGIFNAAVTNWGKDSVKRMIIFGDAPPKDADFKDKALAALHISDTGDAELDYIQIYAIQVDDDPETATVFKELAELTGGKYIKLDSDSDNVADAIFDFANDGTSKDDTIVGNDKDNTFEGKGGDDTIHGGLGSDTYIEGPGAGKDTIIEINPNGKDTNRIDFTGSSFYDTTFARNGDDLIVTGKDTSVTVTGFYDHTDGHKVDDFVFDDAAIDYAMAVLYADAQQGKTITYTNVDEHVKNATLNGKQLFIVAEDDAVVKTSDTQDVVIVNGDNVEVNTGANSDKIYINGSGKIEGGLGSDEYFIGKEFGEVKIYDQTGGSDQLSFTNHNVSDLFISWQGKDLMLQLLDNSDSKVVIEQQGKILHRIESIEFKDGSELTFKELESAAKIYQNYNYADVAADASIMDSIMQQMHQQHLI